MKRPATLAIFALLAGCATAGPYSGPTPQWLAGTWLPMADGVEFPLACASGLPIAYAADGTYTTFEESGVWRLDGDRITETATVAHEDVMDPAEADLGRPFVSRIRRTGANAMRKTISDGTVMLFRRCPPER